jgi:hypothetical protein
VQELLAGIEPSNVTVEVLVLTMSVTQVLVGVPEATVKPVGNVSTRGVLKVTELAFRFVNVIVRVASSPAVMLAGLKALLTVGGTIPGVLTVKVATAGAALGPLLVVKVPAASELM